MRIPVAGGAVVLADRTVRRDGQTLRLTEREADLLAWLAAHPGEWFTPEALLVAVWGYAPGVRSRTAYATMNRLRAKVERSPENPVHLESARGLGYRFVPLTGEAPAEVDGFIGRTAALSRLADLLSGGARLISIIGPGGVGKTRLAQHLTRTTPAVLVPLEDARTAGDVRHRLEQHADGLLILDRFAHLVAPAAGVVAAWLAGSANRRLVVTTRQALGIRGEHRLQLDPLSPDEAVALLQLRAREHGAADVDPEEVRILVERLDRLPLAIELAAAWSAILPPARIPERLTSLDDVIGWSWSLLSAEDQHILAQAAVFAGRFTLGAAEAVLQGEDIPGALLRLRSCSMLTAREGRLGLLASVRAFLKRHHPAPDAVARHEAHYLAWGAACARAVEVDGKQAELSALAAALPELLQIAEQGSPAVARQALSAAFPVLRTQGRAASYIERLDAIPGPWTATQHFQRADLDFLVGDAGSARARLQTALAATDDDLLRCRIRWALARADYNENDLDGVAANLQAALSLAEACDAHHLHARLQESLGVLALARGELSAAEGHYQQARAAARTIGARLIAAHATMNLGNISRRRGDHAEARRRFAEALAEMRALGNLRDEAFLLKNLGLLALDEPDADPEPALDAARRFTATHQLPRIEAEVKWGQGRLLHRQGRLPEAEALLREAVYTFRTRSVHRLLGLGLCSLAAVVAERRDPAAEAMFAEAEAVLTARQDPRGLAVLAVSRGFLALGAAPTEHPDAALSDDLREALRGIRAARRRATAGGAAPPP